MYSVDVQAEDTQNDDAYRPYLDHFLLGTCGYVASCFTTFGLSAVARLGPGTFNRAYRMVHLTSPENHRPHWLRESEHQTATNNSAEIWTRCEAEFSGTSHADNVSRTR